MWLVKLVATPQVLRMIGFKRFKSVQIFMKHQDARNIFFGGQHAGATSQIQYSQPVRGTPIVRKLGIYPICYILAICRA